MRNIYEVFGIVRLLLSHDQWSMVIYAEIMPLERPLGVNSECHIISSRSKLLVQCKLRYRE